MSGFDGQFRLLKVMETSFSSLTCYSGCLSIYRREAVHEYIHAWARDNFLGIKNFKFATDRRPTAYVLGAKAEEIRKPCAKVNGQKNDSSNIPIIQTGEDYLNVMSVSSDPNQESLNKKDKRRYAWRVVYSPSVRVTAGVLDSLWGLILQQIRWRKSFVRSLTATGGMYWRRPFYTALLYYLILAVELTRPFVVIKALLFLPVVSHDVVTSALYIGEYCTLECCTG
jgi:hyaluronan synthase